MKVYIFCDMEGITGVSCCGHVLADHPEYSKGRRFMADDINACIEGCFQGGATEVTVRDGHGSGNNVDPKAIDPRAKLVQGPASSAGRFPEVAGTAAMILLGYHAKAGTPGALLEHTFSSGIIQNFWLNGKKIGEMATDASIASEYGIPVVMVSGDDKTEAEAARDLPGVPFCRVKNSTGLEECVSLPFEDAHRMITETAAEAVRNYTQIAPVKVDYPVTFRIEFVERKQIEKPGVYHPDPLDIRTVETVGNSVEKALFELF